MSYFKQHLYLDRLLARKMREAGKAEDGGDSDSGDVEEVSLGALASNYSRL